MLDLDQIVNLQQDPFTTARTFEEMYFYFSTGKEAKETQATIEELKGENPTSQNEVGCNNNKATRGNSSCRDSRASQTSGVVVAQANLIQTENTGNKQVSETDQKDCLFIHSRSKFQCHYPNCSAKQPS